MYAGRVPITTRAASSRRRAGSSTLHSREIRPAGCSAPSRAAPHSRPHRRANQPKPPVWSELTARQNGALPGASQRERVRTAEHLERAQDPEVHPEPSPHDAQRMAGAMPPSPPAAQAHCAERSGARLVLTRVLKRGLKHFFSESSALCARLSSS